jgi:hypothetical protein
MSEGAPGREGGDRGEEEARGSLVRSDSTGLCRRSPQVSANDFVSLAAMQEGKKGGEGRGECGLLIGSVRGRNGRALTRIEGEELRGRKRSLQVSVQGGR